MKVFNSESTFTLTEGNDMEKQRPYTSCPCCGCLHRKRTFRVWQILLFLFVVIGIIVLLCFLIAMFGPGNTELKYRSPQRTLEDAGGMTLSPTKAKKYCLCYGNLICKICAEIGKIMSCC